MINVGAVCLHLLNLKKFWNVLCNRNNAGKTVHVFVRRGLIGLKNAKLLLFYVTNPHKEIQGGGEFIEQITGDATELWKTRGHESLLRSYEEYTDFIQGRRKSTYIRFKNLRELSTPIRANVIFPVIGIKRMPRMDTYMTKK